MENCIFCRISNKKEKTDLIFEGSDIVVFKDINPSAPVHYLVVPKRHISSIKDMTDKDKNLAGDLIFTAKNVAREAGLEGYKLVFNVGREGGQVIDHLHLHLLGGWTGSNGGRQAPGRILDK